MALHWGLKTSPHQMPVYETKRSPSVSIVGLIFLCVLLMCLVCHHPDSGLESPWQMSRRSGSLHPTYQFKRSLSKIDRPALCGCDHRRQTSVAAKYLGRSGEMWKIFLKVVMSEVFLCLFITLEVFFEGRCEREFSTGSHRQVTVIETHGENSIRL